MKSECIQWPTTNSNQWTHSLNWFPCKGLTYVVISAASYFKSDNITLLKVQHFYWTSEIHWLKEKQTNSIFRTIWSSCWYCCCWNVFYWWKLSSILFLESSQIWPSINYEIPYDENKFHHIHLEQLQWSYLIASLNPFPALDTSLLLISIDLVIWRCITKMLAVYTHKAASYSRWCNFSRHVFGKI